MRMSDDEALAKIPEKPGMFLLIFCRVLSFWSEDRLCADVEMRRLIGKRDEKAPPDSHCIFCRANKSATFQKIVVAIGRYAKLSRQSGAIFVAAKTLEGQCRAFYGVCWSTSLPQYPAISRPHHIIGCNIDSEV